jgi:hypothetical protein
MKKYLYAIFLKPNEFNIGSEGVDHQSIYLVHFENISAIISDCHETGPALNKENILAHHYVVQEAMEKYAPVLPIRFGTISQTEENIQNYILKSHYDLLKRKLKLLEGKVEVNVSANWIDYEKLIASFSKYEEIKEMKLRENRDINLIIEAGQIIQSHIDQKRMEIKSQFLQSLKKYYLDVKDNDLIEEEGIFNLSFLIEKDKEEKFRQKIIKMDKANYQDKIELIYSGPIPAYDFSEVVLSPSQYAINR